MRGSSPQLSTQARGLSCTRRRGGSRLRLRSGWRDLLDPSSLLTSAQLSSLAVGVYKGGLNPLDRKRGVSGGRHR